MPTLQKQIIYVYNKFAKTFIREIKNQNPEVKESLKKNYLCFDKQSDEYLIHFKSECDKIRQLEDIFISGDLDQDIVEEIHILKDIRVGDIQAESKQYYLSTFYLLSKLYDDAEAATEDEKKTSGLKAILVCALKVLNGGYDEDEVLDEIFDDTYRALLQNVTKHVVQDSSAEEALPDMLSGIHDTKIGKLAQEISGQIDLSTLNTGSMNSINDLFSGENNAMSSIIQQVSSVMADKMQKGELNQDELMQEAFAMMGKVKDDEMFQHMMQEQNADWGDVKVERSELLFLFLNSWLM